MNHPDFPLCDQLHGWSDKFETGLPDLEAIYSMLNRYCPEGIEDEVNEALGAVCVAMQKLRQKEYDFVPNGYEDQHRTTLIDSM